MHKSNKLVSIVITCYNYGQYVGEAINSVFLQAYKNIELIVINDGSTDNTDELIKNLLRKHNFKYIKQENRGVCSARNRAANVSKGEYIVFLDGDDVIPNDYISTGIEMMNDEISIVYCNSHYFQGASGQTNFPEYNKELMLYTNFITISALMKREVWQSIKFDEKLNRLSMEDWLFFLNASENGYIAALNHHSFLGYRIKDRSRKDAPVDQRIKAFRYITEPRRANNSNYNFSLGMVDYFISELVKAKEELDGCRTKVKSLNEEIDSLKSLNKRIESKFDQVSYNLKVIHDRPWSSLFLAITKKIKFKKRRI